jgi:glycosyltransferase involved in cell wall biosynthesis
MIKSSDLTVVIPTIPPRAGLLARAIGSVQSQTFPVGAYSIAVDTDKVGAAGNRQKGLKAVTTKWTLFLDDDDEFMMNHVHDHVVAAEETGADFVYAWFDTVPYGRDPFPLEFLHAPWWPDRPRHTTITVMVRTELAKEVGFELSGSTPEFANEDWIFILKCNELGKIHHIQNSKTWLWHHDSGNTSGLPTRW